MTRVETVKLWTERLQRFEQAQITVAEFCTAEGVSQPSFYNWKRKLRSARDPKASAVAKFVPVTEDARVPIDNNDCEQLMKRMATGRKNWLFKGSLSTGGNRSVKCILRGGLAWVD